MAEVEPADQEGAGADPDLAAWVAALVGRHDLAMAIPACWARHQGLAEELAALRDAADAAQSPEARLRWHGWLQDLVAHVAERPAGRCAQAMKHHEPHQWPHVTDTGA